MKSVLFKHRSIRKFCSTPVPEELLQEILAAASRASTCGNMQLYSLVVTRDAALTLFAGQVYKFGQRK